MLWFWEFNKKGFVKGTYYKVLAEKPRIIDTFNPRCCSLTDSDSEKDCLFEITITFIVACMVCWCKNVEVVSAAVESKPKPQADLESSFP